jgi:hypothetical protein
MEVAVMSNELALSGAPFEMLSCEEMYLVDGGAWVKTAFGVVGGVIGGAATFIGVTASTAPVLTPLGSAIVGAVATPAGAATGFVAGVEAYKFLFE